MFKLSVCFVFLLVSLLCFTVWIMQKNLDQRTNLKFLVAQDLTPVQCWNQLHSVYGDDCMSKPTVRRWHKKFREGDGHTPITDELRSGRPRSQRTAAQIQHVSATLQQDRRKTIKELAKETGMTWSTTQKVVTKDLKLSRKAAKFIPRILSPEQKRARKSFCEQNLERLKADPYLLDKLVCGDKSPVYILDPENKFQSSLWLPAGAPRPTKALRSHSQKKTMLTCFFDSCGTILIEFSEGKITAETYIETLRCLRENIRRKRPGMWIGGVDGNTDREFILQHDNASPHTSVLTLAFLFDQDMLAHPPYSPDLAPADFFLFPTLKKKLRGIHHRTLPGVKAAVRRELRSIPDDEFQRALINLPTRWRKCIQAEGEYFEGRGIVPDFDPLFDVPQELSTDPSDEED